MTQKPLRDERGASAVEYGLLVSGVAAVIAIAVYSFGGVTGDMFTESCETIRIETRASTDSCS